MCERRHVVVRAAVRALRAAAAPDLRLPRRSRSRFPGVSVAVAARACSPEEEGGMLACVACSRQLGGGGGLPTPLHEPPEEEDGVDGGGGVGGAATPSTRQAIKALTAQVGSLLRTVPAFKCRFFFISSKSA